MRRVALDEATKLYTCCAAGRLSTGTVECGPLRTFYRTVSRLEYDLGEAREDEVWRGFCARLKRYRFDLCATPLPVSWYGQALLDLMHLQRERIQSSYPRFLTYVERLNETVTALALGEFNPLADTLEQIVRSQAPATAALLVRVPRMWPEIEAVFGNRPDLARLRLVDEHELRLETYFDALFVVGPRHWFPDYVFTSPRALSTFSIRYEWLTDRWSPTQAFIGAVRRDDSPAAVQPVDKGMEQGAVVQPSPESEIGDDDTAWSLDLELLSTSAARQLNENHDQDEVLALPCLLAGGMAVWLDAEDGATSLVLDLEGSDGDEAEEDDYTQTRLVRLPNTDIRPGMFLLLRTSGGGDYIVPLADKILGKDAARVRAMQSRWKDKLRAAVRGAGLFETCIQLLDLGSERANETNLRNWMSSRNIRPREYVDFLAIMRLGGLENDAAEYWRAARTIDAAHRRAGFRLRRMLLQEALRADIAALHHRGRLDFRISEADMGSLSAFRLEHYAADPVLVPAALLGHPFIVGDDKWHA